VKSFLADETRRIPRLQFEDLTLRLNKGIAMRQDGSEGSAHQTNVRFNDAQGAR
jgi:hypothetical protein